MMADLATFYFNNDSHFEVVAYSCDDHLVTGVSHKDRPLVSLSELTSKYPPSQFDVFVAIGYSQLNDLRKEKFTNLRSKGYKLASYISSKTSSWKNSFEIGENVFIMEHNAIQPFCKIGDNVLIWLSNMISHHSVIEAHTTITSHVVMGGGVTIGESCFVGSNATLRDGISIASRTIIGSAANVIASIDKPGLYVGNPAKFRSTTEAVTL